MNNDIESHFIITDPYGRIKRTGTCLIIDFNLQPMDGELVFTGQAHDVANYVDVATGQIHPLRTMALQVTQPDAATKTGVISNVPPHCEVRINEDYANKFVVDDGVAEISFNTLGSGLYEVHLDAPTYEKELVEMVVP